MSSESVSDWLAEIGLSQYTPLFAEHEIGLDVLDELTEADLEKLGIPLGPRKRLLKAITARSADVVAERGAGETVIATGPAADRRQITVLFCDLVGSTELSRRLDPEDLRSLIRMYQDVCVSAVERFEGHIAQFLGDGILAYFGYPRALEDAAGGAIRAALAILGRIAETSQQMLQPMRVRLGIDTGLVVIGHADTLHQQDQLAIGDVPNLAARLQSLAEPDTVVASERTRALTAGSFEFLDLGPQLLKGIAEAIRCWRVLRERQLETRFDAQVRGAVEPLVGREMEFTIARQAWQSASAGQAQALLLCGEPGIGKSRIVRALRDHLATLGARVWQYQCVSNFANTALHPIIAQIEGALGFEREDSPGVRLNKLEGLLKEQLGRPLLDITLIGRLLGLPAEERYGALRMSPQKLKAETLRAFYELIAPAGSNAPAFLLFEDIHWADPTTIEAIDFIMGRSEGLRALVVLTYRPEFKPQWVGWPGVVALTLGRLDAAQTVQLISRVAGGKRLPREILTQIITKTDGVPLFIEELTKAILESNIVRAAGDEYELVGPISALVIPSTLRDSLMVRLDRQALVKEIAQIGACIGREFSDELLAMVAPLSRAKLDEGLGQIVESELAFRRGSGAQAQYVFKHALVQDAAYDSLLKSRRAEVHGRIAAAFERHFPEVVSKEPELVAHHCSEAGLLRKAIEYWKQAGDLSLLKNAPREAVAHFQRAVAALGGLNVGQEREALEAQLQVALGFALMPVKGWTASEVRVALDRVRALSLRTVEGRQTQVRATWGIAAWHLLKAELREAEAMCSECHDIARQAGNVEMMIEASWLRGNAIYRQGKLALAQVVLEEGLKLYRPELYRGQAYANGQDPRVAAQFFLTQVLWARGWADQAQRLAANTLEFARELKHPFTLAWGLNTTRWIYIMRWEWGAAIEGAGEMIRLCEREGFAYWANWANLAKGIALVKIGETEQGIHLIESVDAMLSKMESLEWITLRNLYLAEGYAAAERMQEALRCAEKGIEWAERSGETFHHSALLKVRGELALRAPEADVALAERYFREAVHVAQMQQAKAFELIAAESLARLLMEQGQTLEAKALLHPIVSSMPEGLDTPAFAPAVSLLARL